MKPNLNNPSCPECGAIAAKFGKDSEGKQRYKCSSCGKRFTPGTKQRARRSHISCPLCNGFNTKRNGRDKGGDLKERLRDRGYCRDCKRSFYL